ncbi:hypothetical protein LTR86_004786 [Recurvomyces mirabilis]|nr:hypothetical protein LTR86_004786 [Recurvomyces mirabilis]
MDSTVSAPSVGSLVNNVLGLTGKRSDDAPQDNTSSTGTTSTTGSTSTTGTTSTSSAPSTSTSSSTGVQPKEVADKSTLESGNATTVHAADEETSLSEEVAPAVEHETVKKQHETREQVVLDKEKHQDHYHTTIQPLKDTEVKDTKENSVEAERQYREVNHQNNDVKAKVAQREGAFEDSTDVQKSEVKSQAPTVENDHVHHHLHETIQPVIEKETIEKSITHKTIPITERHQEVDVDRGTTVNKAISKEEFARKLEGENAGTVKTDVAGGPEVVSDPTVSK